MKNMNIFITGISRGIGLGLTRKALAQGHLVLGVARRPGDSLELSTLASEFPDTLRIISLDLRSNEAAQAIRQALLNLSTIDLLINNAGILEEGTDKKEFLESFEVNAFVPFMVTQVLLLWLEKSSHPKVVHVSSMMGSIADNASGGYYAYRSSKAALNMINKSLSLDHPWLTSVVVHPGWVQTRMGGPGATTPVAESVEGLWEVIEGLKPIDSGSFFDYRGLKLPW